MLTHSSVKETRSILWEFQYKRQFNWLTDTRQFLYRQISIGRCKRILETGCSTALVTEELTKRTKATVIGLDTNIFALRKAKTREKKLLLVCGDIYNFPFKKSLFNCVLFQFLLLWLKKPLIAIKAMIDTIFPGGWLLALGEPDYGGRIDFPSTVNNSFLMQEKLRKEGANPFIGRELEYLFMKASLDNVQWGLSSIPFGIKLCKENFSLEWKFIKLLLATDNNGYLKEMKDKEKRLLDFNKRSYFMPVFHCIGRKKTEIAENG